jgi:DNA-directed DNA polymerase III PolC
MYVSLHNRSAYSFHSSLIQPVDLARFAAHHQMPAIALTDFAGLYGAIAFYRLCESLSIRPIIGTELTLADHTHVILLARNLTGYGQLCRLVTLYHLQDQTIEIDSIVQHAAHVICMVGQTADMATLDRTIHRLRPAFENRLYVELTIHSHEGAVTARRRARLADELSIPVVATSASRCLRADQMAHLRALASIGSCTRLEEPHPNKPEGFWHVRTPKEMHRLFRRRPDALANTLRIAEQCQLSIDFDRNRFPKFHGDSGTSPIQKLRALCIAGCRRRYLQQPPQRGMGGRRPTLTEALERLDRELRVIEQVHYAEYFLVFHEIAEYCRKHDISMLARGSAADSLVCYALGVSHACPFRFDLPFDRFLNPERAKFSKMADIDLDLPWDQRDEVVNWVYNRWGHDHVAMIGSPNTFHGRAAVVELGKVFSLPPHEIHQFTKRLPRASADTLRQAIRHAPEAAGLPTEQEPYRTILDWAGAFEGLPRHWSLHPCGLVVSPDPFTDLVPVQRSAKGPLVTQYDMDSIESLGFIKIDLLGQAGLSVLRDTVDEIQRTDDISIDLDHDICYSDRETWEMIATGQARGVHHIESPAMTNLLAQCNCRDIDCLTTIVAIIRPGAANQGKKDSFARRYQGFELPEYVHPVLIPILKQTFGLMVFEEHILQVAVEFAGMNIGRADVLRRALNKQSQQLIQQLKEEFWFSAKQRGYSQKDIEQVWSQLQNFAGFMFNKAHSAEYAIEAFQGAWLKYRWPAHYLAAILSNERGFYAHACDWPQILYVIEALRLGIGFQLPCVNRSRRRFSVEYESSTRKRQHIRVPLFHIAGLSHELLSNWQTAREQGPFTDLDDFLDRCHPGQADGQRLLDSGALDCFELSRPEIFWKLRCRCLTPSAGTWLWQEYEGATDISPPIELIAPSSQQRARKEMQLIGFPITIGLWDFISNDDRDGRIDWSRYVPISELMHHINQKVWVAGIIAATRTNQTVKGEFMKFVTIADPTGFAEAHVFPKAYRQFGHLIPAHPVLAARACVETFENQRGITLRVEQLAKPARRAARPQAS